MTNTRDTGEERKETNNRKRSETSKRKSIKSENTSTNHMISERSNEETSDCHIPLQNNSFRGGKQ